jgi:sulfofructose kinase
MYPDPMPPVPSIDLVGVGLNATDTLISLPHFPAPGSKVAFSSASVLPGGQVATVVVACQRWGLRTRYVGKLGEDDAAALHRREFQRAGVETRIVVAPGAASPQSIILVDPEGERTVLNRRDERLTLRPDELRREWIVNARVLHLDGYDTQAAILAATWARQAGVLVVADLDELYPGIEALLPLLDFIIVSRDFPERLTGTADLDTALRRIHARYHPRLAAATLGSDGVLAWDGRQEHAIPAYRVHAADTTGAGDIFHAGFIYGLLQGWPLDRQLRFGCAAAALNCTAMGARGGIPTVAEAENLIACGATYTPPFAPEHDAVLAEDTLRELAG